MALTTQDANRIKENVITDVNANVAAPNAPARVLSREAANLFNKSIVAKPLMTPEAASIHVKNTEYAYRWVSLKAGGGWLYSIRKTQGFTNATPDDVDLLGGDATCTGGSITAGDVILMKIQADKYDGAIKYNELKAFKLAQARGVYMQGASTDVFADQTPTRQTVAQEPFARTGLARPFIPDNAESLVNESITSGRADKARAAVDGLRGKDAGERS